MGGSNCQNILCAGLFGGKPDFEMLGMPELEAATRTLGQRSFDEVIDSTSRSSINEQNRGGRTALSFAVEYGDVDKVKRLLQKGADPKMEDKYGRVPLLYWAWNGRHEQADTLLELLDASASINRADVYGSTALSLACDCPGVSVTTLKKLKDYGANIHVRDGYSNSILDRLMFQSQPRMDIVAWLIENGADMNARNRYGTTPVMAALLYDRLEALEWLLSRGVDYKIPTEDNYSILHVAALHGSILSLKVLQRANLHLHALQGSDNYGGTPLDYARWRRDKNSEWPDWIVLRVELDEDPQKSFDEFEILYEGVVERSQEMELQECFDGFEFLYEGVVLQDTDDADNETYENPSKTLPGSFPDD